MGTHPIFESDFDCLTECAMGVWSVFPSSVLNWINEAGPYYYACYLSINICAYVPVGLFCAGAIRHPTIGKWTTHFVKSRLQKAENQSSQFALGFTLGLLANETILMPPQLVLAAPLTPIFKGLVSHLPWLDDKFHSVGDYCLESLRKELEKRQNQKFLKSSVPDVTVTDDSVTKDSVTETNALPKRA